MRIDKWLWAARFFKKRGLATEAVNGGHIQINGERIKASKHVKIGDQLSILRHQEQFIIVVTAITDKRDSATIAQTLYQETEVSLAAREKQKELRKINALHSPAPQKRPDKQARRKIIRFTRRED
ncbi:MAG: S4 domain-containing protein [Mariprofundaceae bacterium]